MLKFETFSVNKTLEVKGEYTYHITDIIFFPFAYNPPKNIPWYYEVNWLSSEWQNNLGKIDRFFSFPYNKNKSEIVINGLASGELTDLKNPKDIIIKIDNVEYNPKKYSMVLSQNESMKFTIIIEIDKNLKSLNNLTLQMKGVNVRWQNLDEYKSVHYIFSNYQEYINKFR